MDEIKYKHEVTIKKVGDNQYLTRLLIRQTRPTMTHWKVQRQKVFDHAQVCEFLKLCKKDGLEINVRKLV